MKYIDTQFYKNKGRSIITLLCAAILVVVFSCTDNEEIIYTQNDEPIAMVGFSESKLTVTEGGLPAVFEMAASKNLFSDSAASIVVLEGDGSEVTITDDQGNPGPNFTILEGSKAIRLLATVENDDAYRPTRSITYGFSNYQGEGATLADTTYSSSGRRVVHQFKLTIVDDEPIPPLASFAFAESTAFEDDGTHNVVISMSEGTLADETLDLVFSGTAVEGTNYSVPGMVNGVLTVNIPAGETEINVPLTMINNPVVEQDLSIIMDMVNPSNGVYPGLIKKHTVTLIDANIPTETILVYVEADTYVGEGTGGSGDRRNQHQNFGGHENVKINLAGDGGNDETHHGLFRFDISSIDHTKVVDAKFVLTTEREDRWEQAQDRVGTLSFNLHEVADDDWEEGDRESEWWDSESDLNYTWVTYANAPEFGAILTTYVVETPVEEGTTSIHEFDVRDKLRTAEADGKLSFGLNPALDLKGKRIYYQAREHSDGDGAYLKIILRTD